MLTMYPGMVNSPITELAVAIDETQTTIEVIDGTKLPDAPNLAIIGLGEDAETILYTEKTGNILSGVTRGFQGVAKAWGQGTRIARFFTEYDQRAMMQNIQENADNLVAHLNDTMYDGVHGLKTTGDVTIYVDSVNGNDANPGTQSQPLKTIGAAVGKITSLIIDNGHTVTIQLAPGTYVENVEIKNLHGAGMFYLRGGSNLAEADSYVIDGWVSFIGCTCMTYIYGIKVLGSSSRDGAIIFERCLAGRVSFCKVDKTGRINSTNNYGILAAAHSLVFADDNDISNITGGSGLNAAIQCFETSRVFSVNNTGSNNSIGLRTVAGTIMKNGSQPSGNTAEVILAGGVIR